MYFIDGNLRMCKYWCIIEWGDNENVGVNGIVWKNLFFCLIILIVIIIVNGKLKKGEMI